MIKIVTKKSNRFNKTILINNKQVQVDGRGEAEVEENLVVYALEVGFDLVDPSAKFSSQEEMDKVSQVQDLLLSAKKQAEVIVAEAHKEAESIIEEARKKAGLILEEGHVDQKDFARKNLEEKTVKEIKEILASSGVEEDSYKNLKKEELIDLAIKISFEEEE